MCILKSPKGSIVFNFIVVSNTHLTGLNAFETVQQGNIAWINACQQPLVALLHIPKASSSNLQNLFQPLQALNEADSNYPTKKFHNDALLRRFCRGNHRIKISEFPTPHLGPVSLLSLPKNQHHCQPENGDFTFQSERMWWKRWLS